MEVKPNPLVCSTFYIHLSRFVFGCDLIISAACELKRNATSNELLLPCINSQWSEKSRKWLRLKKFKKNLSSEWMKTALNSNNTVNTCSDSYVHVCLEEVCVFRWHEGRWGQEWCRSIKGSVVITAEAVSVTSRLHYLVSFVPGFAARLIEWNCIFSLWLS